MGFEPSFELGTSSSFKCEKWCKALFSKLLLFFATLCLVYCLWWLYFLYIDGHEEKRKLIGRSRGGFRIHCLKFWEFSLDYWEVFSFYEALLMLDKVMGYWFMHQKCNTTFFSFQKQWENNLKATLKYIFLSHPRTHWCVCEKEVGGGDEVIMVVVVVV